MTSNFIPPHHRASHLTSEIYKTVKHNFVHPETHPYQPQLIWQRRDEKLVVERPEDYWRPHYLRRGDNFNRGFYSVPYEKYKCMGGDVVLDTSDLVYETLNCIDKEKILQGRKETEIKPEVYTPIIPIKHENLGSNTVAIHATNDGRAGFKTIADYLKTTTERRACVRGGLDFKGHVQRVEQRIADQEVKPVESMILQSTSNLEADIAITPINPEIERAVSASQSIGSFNKSRVSSASSKSGGYGSSTGEASKSLMMLHNAIMDRNERIKRDNTEYINAIVEVIITLHNMKSKYLKSKTPLSAAQLRTLKKVESLNRKKNSIKFNKHGSKRQSTETLLSADFSNTMLNDRPTSRLSDSPTSLPKSTRIVPTPNTFGLFSGRRFSKVAQAEEFRMETWEDLVHFDNKDKLTNQQIDGGQHMHITAEMISRTIKWSKAVRDSIVDEKGAKPPIWQIISMEKTSGDSFQEKKKSNNCKDVTQVSQKARKELEKLKENLQRTCEAEVDQINRQTMQYFHHKFESLNSVKFHTLFAKHCNRMRDMSGLIPITAGKPDIIEVLEVPPSKWFDELQIRMFNILGSQDIDVNVALTKLCRFSQMGVRTVPHGRAKLCLLVMSMPAYDLCKISMQLAIKFVLANILTGQPEEFYRWLHLRKMPLVLLKRNENIQ